MPGCGHPLPCGRCRRGHWSGRRSPEGDLGLRCSQRAPCRGRALGDVVQSVARTLGSACRRAAPPPPQPSAGRRLGRPGAPALPRGRCFTVPHLCFQHRPSPRPPSGRGLPLCRPGPCGTSHSPQRPLSLKRTVRCHPQHSWSCPHPLSRPSFVPVGSPSRPLPGPGALRSAVPGAPCPDTGQGGAMACSLRVWRHSVLARARPPAVPRDSPWSAGHAGCLLASAWGPSTSRRHQGCPRGRPRAGSRRTAAPSAPAVCEGPHVSGRHVVPRLCSAVRVRAGAPLPFWGPGGHPR